MRDGAVKEKAIENSSPLNTYRGGWSFSFIYFFILDVLVNVGNDWMKKLKKKMENLLAKKLLRKM